MSEDDIIRKATNDSDIAFGSDLYTDIGRELTEIGINFAFFVFATSEHSSCVRTLDGQTASCPVFTLYLKYDADFELTGIDPRNGNWDDKWPQTRTIRDAVNAILQRHGFGNHYVSDHTFIFVRTLEELAFIQLGCECKEAVQKLVCAEAPGISVTDVFWNGRQFDVILGEKADYKRMNRCVKAKLAKALPKLLSNADTSRNCQSYKATIKFGHTGMNLARLIREDVA
ncbi:MAG: hypothetical protein U1A77_22910 [Pirellulales bacterium]